MTSSICDAFANVSALQLSSKGFERTQNHPLELKENKYNWNMVLDPTYFAGSSQVLFSRIRRDLFILISGS
jgi:hypothetical protein